MTSSIDEVLNSLIKCFGETPESDSLNRYVYAESIRAIQSGAGRSTEGATKKVEKYRALVEANYKPKELDGASSCQAELNLTPGTPDGCITWSSVIGNESTKRDLINGFIQPLIYPGLYGATTKGILLYGPPGTSKTMLAKAAANELRKKSSGNLSLHVYAPTAATLKGKYFGDAEKNIKAVFDCASAAACADTSATKKSISVIILDEIESIAGDRKEDSTGFMTTTVNALLQAMDGVDSAPNVSVIAITNYPWRLDSAILRRLPVQSFVNMPTARDIYSIALARVKTHILTTLNAGSNPVLAFCNPKETKLQTECSDSKWTSNYERFLERFKDKDVMGIAEALARRGFSGSDVTALIARLIKKMGEEAMAVGTFIEADSKFGDFYLSTADMKRSELKDRALLVAQPVQWSLIKYGSRTFVNTKLNGGFSIIDPRVKNVYSTKSKDGEVEILIEVVNKYVVKNTGSMHEETLFIELKAPTESGSVWRQVLDKTKSLFGAKELDDSTSKLYTLEDILRNQLCTIITKSSKEWLKEQKRDDDGLYIEYYDVTVMLSDTMIYEIDQKDVKESLLGHLLKTGKGYAVYDRSSALDTPILIEPTVDETLSFVPIEFDVDRDSAAVIPQNRLDRLYHIYFSSARLMDAAAESQPTNREDEIKELIRYSTSPSTFKPKPKDK